MKMKRVDFYTTKQDLGENVADMLRYDLAFICEAKPRVVAFPTFQTKSGNWGGRVTYGRWQSFAIRTLNPVVKGSEQHFDLQHSLTADRWVTYRHPYNADGWTNYGALEPIPFTKFLEAKGHEQI